MTAKEYTNRLLSAIQWHCNSKNGWFYGRQGALDLAKSYALGLADFPEDEALDELYGSYDMFCRSAYVNPPICTEEWLRVATETWDKARIAYAKHGLIKSKVKPNRRSVSCKEVK
jgi:hypothetical protein